MALDLVALDLVALEMTALGLVVLKVDDVKITGYAHQKLSFMLNHPSLRRVS